MHPMLRSIAAAVLSSSILALPCPASAWEMNGIKEVALHTRDGQVIPIGTITFRPEGARVGFSVQLDYGRFKDFFLSMKEFKCLEGREEIQCHLPYPYANPSTVTAGDLAWLEHSLLFLYKLPTDFGARLWNGLYYRMVITENGIVGTPQAIDLNLISAPPNDTAVVPFGPAERTEIVPGSRWIKMLTIR